MQALINGVSVKVPTAIGSACVASQIAKPLIKFNFRAVLEVAILGYLAHFCKKKVRLFGPKRRNPTAIQYGNDENCASLPHRLVVAGMA